MNEKSKTIQYLIGITLAVIALSGVGVTAFLAGQLFGSKPPPLLPTPTAIPTNTPLPPPVVSIEAVRAKAELSTVEQSVIAEIYKENLPTGWLDNTLGTKEQLLMLVYGNVRAGFDLSTLQEKDLWTDGKRVRLVLPAPKILNSSLNFSRTHIVYYKNNLMLEKNNPNLEGEALAQAQKAIEQAAMAEGILQQANSYGKAYFENLLYSLGFSEVEVVTDTKIFKE